MVLDGLTAADLMYECAACNGSGKIYNPVWDRYNAAAIDPARELPPASHARLRGAADARAAARA